MTRKISQIKVVRNNYIDDFERDVCRLLKEGWSIPDNTAAAVDCRSDNSILYSIMLVLYEN